MTIVPYPLSPRETGKRLQALYVLYQPNFADSLESYHRIAYLPRPDTSPSGGYNKDTVREGYISPLVTDHTESAGHAGFSRDSILPPFISEREQHMNNGLFITGMLLVFQYLRGCLAGDRVMFLRKLQTILRHCRELNRSLHISQARFL